eukprot:TRINITY_DN4261_c0_g4_i1.p1 TRINITY_DN4261_c0_g4~~TRINITY_DN4261_c0_g4_i1.p1  ORF type:complete len:352 (+),score=144.33 TRINITY_DN4261_c0_g4_i1:100-1155(+)
MQQPGPGGFKKGFRQTKGGRASARETKQRQQVKQSLDGIDIVDTSTQHHGSTFRMVMTVFFLTLVGGMLYIKLYGEWMIEPPERDEDDEVAQRVRDEEASYQFFTMMKQEKERMSADDIREEDVSERKARIREEKRRVQEAYDAYEKKYNSGECDEECKRNHQAIQVSYNQISSVVETDYYKVLNVKGRLSKKEMRANYEELKEKIEAGDESVKGMDIAEVKEAYGVLMNNEARMYYNLYGMKPPASMKHNSQFARHGGWGQEFQTQAYKVKKLLAWLNFFDSKTADLSVLGVIVLFSVIPIILNLRQLLHMLKEVYPELQPNYEEHADRMEKLREQGAARGRAGGRRSGR